MPDQAAPHSCDLCGSPASIKTIRLRVSPRTAIETDVCGGCRSGASTLQVIDAGHPVDTDTPYGDWVPTPYEPV